MRKRARTLVLCQGLALGLLGCDGPMSPAAPSPAPRAQQPNSNPDYTLTASPTTVAPGSELSVSWTATRGGARDWIGLFRLEDAACDHGWWESTKGATSGTFTLRAPVKPGEYEFRYHPDDGCEVTARSSSVTVRAGS